MSGYPLIMLNMVEYTDIYLKKKSAEYAKIIVNVSDAVHSIRSLYNFLSRHRDIHIQNTVRYFRWGVLLKE